MRRDGLSAELLDAIVLAPAARRFDRKGNLVAIGRMGNGESIEVVTALDDPGYVITVIARRKPR